MKHENYYKVIYLTIFILFCFDGTREYAIFAHITRYNTSCILYIEDDDDDTTNTRLPTIDDLKKNGIYQPPLVNDYEKEEIMKNAAKLHESSVHNSSSSEGIQSIMIDPGNSHFKQWQQSRRRTLDELESKGVINKDFFNFHRNDTKLSNGKIRIKPDRHETIKPIETRDTRYTNSSTKAQYGIQYIYIFL